MMPLYDSPLAIVDIETTGGHSLYHRIIEIAIIRVERGKAVRTFQSLVNPERYLPPSITQLTGIRQDELVTAPRFESIARAVTDMLSGAVFVAHNARFDHSFIRTELGRLGRECNIRCLCTVKLSRRLFPEHRNHDLNSIIARHGLHCENRHRALGDAKVVEQYLALLARSFEPGLLDATVDAILKKHALPANIDREMVDSLPEAPGVYLFFGSGEELLYVGKSRNIRDRVLAHFTPGNERPMHHQVCRIDFRRTAGEMGALLLESQLIKELQPIYNQVARRKRNLIAVRRTLSADGYAEASVEEIQRIDPPGMEPIMGIFKSVKQAKAFLLAIARSHNLCHKLLGLERTNRHCFAYHLRQCNGACQREENPVVYNMRFEEAFAGRRLKAWPFSGAVAIEERGTDHSGEVFVLDQWRLLSSFRYSELGQTELFPGPMRFDYDSYKVIARYLADPANRSKIRRVADSLPPPEYAFL